MKRKLVSLLCVAAMAASLLAGCGKSNGEDKSKESTSQGEQSTSELEYVELDWYVDLAAMPDCEEVNEALNEYFLEKINTKVNIHYWQASDYSEKVPTMLSSGQDMGIVTFAAFNLPFIQNVSQGAFLPLEDLLAEYGTGIKGLFNDDEWKTVTVDGHIYGIPMMMDNCYIISMIYNEDLANELGLDMENLKFKNWRQNEEFFMEALEKRNELHPEWEGYPLLGDVCIEFPYFFAFERLIDNNLAVCNIDGINDLAGYDCDTVVNFYETEEFREYCLMKQRMVANGIYAYDYEEWEDRLYDGFILADVGWGYTYIDEHMWNDEYTTKLKISENIWTDTSNYTGKGSAISANCVNPERAMMVLELANTDPYVATMLRFGIEGEHYIYNEEGDMTCVGSPKNGNPPDYGYRYWYGPSFGNLLIVDAPVELVGPNEELFEGILECNNKAILPSHMGFVLDTTNIVNELAACSNVVEEYVDNFDYGWYESPEAVEKALDEFIAKLKANNVDKIVQEVQSQIDAWNAAQ